MFFFVCASDLYRQYIRLIQVVSFMFAILSRPDTFEQMEVSKDLFGKAAVYLKGRYVYSGHQMSLIKIILTSCGSVEWKFEWEFCFGKQKELWHSLTVFSSGILGKGKKDTSAVIR